MKKLIALIVVAVGFGSFGCGDTSDDTSNDQPNISKAEARAQGGKGDHGIDFCEWMGWYDDGICDDFCLNPDPDCAATCDDGSAVNPLCDTPEPCADGLVSAVISGCFQCVDAVTCEAPAPPTCDDGSSVSPFCDIREACDAGLVSVVKNGCFECVDPVTCEPPAPQEIMCGGIAGLQCPAGMHCRMDAGMCNVADNAGVCVADFDFCTQEFAPVCGCNGKTYSNACHADAAGAAVDHEGECADPGPTFDCGGFAGLTCESDEYCSYAPDAMCGAADQMGTCTPRPEACIALFDPVCGCDGNTYSNSCVAASAGVSVFSEGACN